MIEIFGFLVVIFLGWGIFSLLSHKAIGSEKVTLQKGFGTAFAIRVCVTILIAGFSYMMVQSYTGFFSDDGPVYDSVGWEIAQSWRSNTFYYYTGKNGFYYFNAIVYYIFGHHPLIIRWFNALIGSLIPVLIFLISKTIYNRRVGKLAMWLSVFSPSMIYYSAMHLKDIQVALMILVVIWSGILFRKKSHLKWATILGLSLLYLFSLRGQYAIIVIISYLLYILACGIAKRGRAFSTSLAILGILIGVYLVSLKLPIRDFTPWKVYEQTIVPVSDVSQLQGEYVRSGYYLRHSFLSQENLAPKNIIFAIIRGTFSPTIPYTVKNLIDTFNPQFFFEFLISIFWIAVSPFWILGLLKTIKDKFIDSLPVYITCLGIFIAASLGGVLFSIRVATMRHKISAIPLFLILSGYGIFKLKTDAKSQALGKIIIGIYWIVVILVTAIYAEYYTGVNVWPLPLPTH